MVTFRIDFCIGLLLQSVLDNSIIYFHAWNTAESNTDFLFDKPIFVRNWDDAHNLVQDVTVERIIERARNKRPNSEYQVISCNKKSSSHWIK